MTFYQWHASDSSANKFIVQVFFMHNGQSLMHDSCHKALQADISATFGCTPGKSKFHNLFLCMHGFLHGSELRTQMSKIHVRTPPFN